MTSFLFWIWLFLTTYILWEIRMDIKIIRADTFAHRIEFLKMLEEANGKRSE